jgi:hypothetical protein
MTISFSVERERERETMDCYYVTVLAKDGDKFKLYNFIPNNFICFIVINFPHNQKTGAVYASGNSIMCHGKITLWKKA